jgi:hypothetical protein
MNNKNRWSGIDFFKAVGMVSMVFFHTEIFRYSNGEVGKQLYFWFISIQSFAPIFFALLSGYLWGFKIRSAPSISQVAIKYTSRILKLYLFWCFIYLIVPSIPVIEQHGIIGLIKAPYWRLSNLIENPLQLLFEGTAGHLWFFVSLLCALIISTICLIAGLDYWLIPFGCALYIFGLLGHAYSVTPFGFQINFNTRDGPFYITLAFAIGWCFSGYKGTFSNKMALTLLMGGLALHLTEVYYFWHYFNKFPVIYTFGAIPVCLGIAMLVLSRPEFGKDSMMARLGILMPGMYGCHMLFVYLLRPVRDTWHSYLWEISFPVIVFTMTAVTAVALSKNKFFRRFVV